VTVTASTATTCSIFAKAGTCSFLRMLLADTTGVGIAGQAWFNLGTGAVGTTAIVAGAATSVSATIQSIGNSWYRCTLTTTLSTATTAVMLLRMCSGDGVTTDVGSKTMSFFAPQLEDAGFASSPILTTTAAVTRPADVATIAPLGNWYGASEGTVFAEVQIPTQTSFATTAVSFGLSDGTINQSIYLSAPAASDVWNVVNSNVAQASISNATPPLTVKKVAGAYKVNDFAFCRNGGTVSTDTSGTIPAGIIQAGVGKAAWSNANYLNGYLRRIRVYDRRLPNAVLQMITS
jgi:hypothetical protein